jgi:hypothetical protein
MTTMYDSTNAADVPSGGSLYAGYINGKYQSYYGMVQRFGTNNVLSITVMAHTGLTDGWVAADILDIESGDALPSEAPGWVTEMRDLARPIITCYCSRKGTWPATLAAFQAAKVPLPDFWIADYTNQPHLVPGSVATQWTDTGPYDISLTNGSWPLSTAVLPDPLPPIQTYPVGARTMNVVAVKTDTNGNGYLPTSIPWSSFCAATIGGSDPDPSADDAYWPGYCKVQNRSGMVLVSVVGCLPSSVQNVFVLTS